MTSKVLPRTGKPDGWSERHKSELAGIILPDGAEFYSTPGHGFLRVDFDKLPASVSAYDYLDEPHHALLEEDCSATMWLAEMGLMPLEGHVISMIKSIPRTSAYGLLHPGQTVIEAGIVQALDGKIYKNPLRIIAGRSHEEPMPTRLANALAPGTSVQTGLPGIEQPAQVKMFEECNTATGQGGSRPGLLDTNGYHRTTVPANQQGFFRENGKVG